MEKSYLSTFFAVTRNSVIEVIIFSQSRHDWHPAFRRILWKENGRFVKFDKRVGKGYQCYDGTMIAVTRLLVLFCPTPRPNRELLRSDRRFWGQRTLPIVALFLEEPQACICFEEPDLQERDHRWRRDTIATLRAIGPKHPYCAISTLRPREATDSYFEPLMEPAQWQH